MEYTDDLDPYFQMAYHLVRAAKEEEHTYCMCVAKSKVYEAMHECVMCILENLNGRHGKGEWDITFSGHGPFRVYHARCERLKTEFQIGRMNHPKFPDNLSEEFLAKIIAIYNIEEKMKDGRNQS